MPQLVKGGKHVFGWSQVTEKGQIRVPPEAFTEYELDGCDKMILMSGSKRSGGFGLTTVEKLKGSDIGQVLGEFPELASYAIPEGEAVRKGSRYYCWTSLDSDGFFSLPSKTLSVYGIKPGQKVLVARGSGLAIGFLARGLIFEQAKKHNDLKVF